MLGNEPGRRLIRILMEEVESVAKALGMELPVGIDKRIEGAAATGAHKTSMLQDIELGKPLELDALLGAVVELAGWQGVEVPGLSMLYALAKMAETSALRKD